MTSSPTTTSPAERQFSLSILGRTLEHFGAQMYKQRPAAIAELVANCWDAGAELVEIELPTPSSWDDDDASIVVRDDGSGMSQDDIEHSYLVLGRNRREAMRGTESGSSARPIMGRKGIGKLAGFGIARSMEVRTWQDGVGWSIELDLDKLKLADGKAGSVNVPGKCFEPQKQGSGTEIVLSRLKATGGLDEEELRVSLSRKFSRRVRGAMQILVNGVELPCPFASMEFLHVEPTDFADELTEVELPSGDKIRVGYGYAKQTIKSREMRGFTVLVHGKTAQVPPYFFDVEGTASGQHSTKYITGVIEADYLDDGISTEDDIVSTDRQEIDWTSDRTRELFEFGQRLSRDCLSECTDMRGKTRAKEIVLKPEFLSRLGQLVSTERKRADKLIAAVASADPDDEAASELVGSIISIFEFAQFHDMADQIEALIDDPEQLVERLGLVKEWQVLESRAIKEIIHGRLEVIDMFQKALVNDLPETASKNTTSSLHDAIGRFPWLLNPDYQIFADEQSIVNIVRQLADDEMRDEPEERGRVDFAALADDSTVVLIEIKRNGIAISHEELQRFDRYKAAVIESTNKAVRQILIYGGKRAIKDSIWKDWEGRDTFQAIEYSSLFDTTKQRYERYRAILTMNAAHPDFSRQGREVVSARDSLENESFGRGRGKNEQGPGSHDL